MESQVGSPGLRRRRREPDADAAGAPDADNRLDHREGETQTVLDRAAVLVGPVIARVADELLEQVVVRRVNLDAVEPGRLRVLRRATVVLDDRRNLLRLQRARFDVVLHPVGGERLTLRPDRGRGDREIAAVQVGVGDASGVPQLQHEAPVAFMDGLDHGLPGLHLGLRPDPRGERVADRLGRDVRRLRDDQTRVCALTVVVGGEVRYAALLVRAAARHRGHDDAVGKLEITDGDRSEECLRHSPGSTRPHCFVTCAIAHPAADALVAGGAAPRIPEPRPHGLVVRTPAFHAGDRRFEPGWGYHEVAGNQCTEICSRAAALRIF